LEPILYALLLGAADFTSAAALLYDGGAFAATEALVMRFDLD